MSWGDELKRCNFLLAPGVFPMFEAVYSKSILGLASEQSRAIDSRHVLCCLFLQDKREGRVQQTSIGNGNQNPTITNTPTSIDS